MMPRMGCVVVSVDGMCRFNFPNGNNLKQQWSHIGVFICYQNINARKKQNKKQKKKNSKFAHLYGIYLLNPYNTVVSHLKLVSAV